MRFELKQSHKTPKATARWLPGSLQQHDVPMKLEETPLPVRESPNVHRPSHTIVAWQFANQGGHEWVEYEASGPTRIPQNLSDTAVGARSRRASV
jgi:hypothetical protein